MFDFPPRHGQYLAAAMPAGHGDAVSAPILRSLERIDLDPSAWPRRHLANVEVNFTTCDA